MVKLCPALRDRSEPCNFYLVNNSAMDGASFVS